MTITTTFKLIEDIKAKAGELGAVKMAYTILTNFAGHPLLSGVGCSLILRLTINGNSNNNKNDSLSQILTIIFFKHKFRG